MSWLSFVLPSRAWEDLEFEFLGSGLHSNDWHFSSETILVVFFHNSNTKKVELID